MEKAFHLPFVDGTLRTAQVIWIYDTTMQTNGVLMIRAPSVRIITSLRCVSEQKSFRRGVTSQEKGGMALSAQNELSHQQGMQQHIQVGNDPVTSRAQSWWVMFAE